MDKLNVYLSSPYMEFAETRHQFLKEIRLRSYIYEINAMEMYPAKDVDVLETCIADVKRCHIYVLILGDKYGSIAKKNGKDSGKSFTYWEYETAKEKKENDKNFARLILLKAGATTDENPLLTEWKKEIGDSQIQTVWYSLQDEIPKKIIESLDNFTLERIQYIIRKKDIVKDKIYLCNREEANLEFSVSIDNSEDPIRFFVLRGHDYNMLQYFIKRKELEYEDRGQKWKDIPIKPLIPARITSFEEAERYIRAAIFNELKGEKFKSPKDVHAENIVQYMTENNINYVSVSWSIDSTLWKNDKLKEFIVSLYQKYALINSKLKTDKKIFYFAILRYVPCKEITEKGFYEQVKSVEWETNLPVFSKITKQDVKDWLTSNEIENIEMRMEELISLYLKKINEIDMYYNVVEPALQRMLDLYNKQ